MSARFYFWHGMTICLLLIASAARARAQDAASGYVAPSEYVFENLGRPMDAKPIEIDFVTPAPENGAGHIAWARVRGTSRRGLVGVNTRTGEFTYIDTTPFGISKIAVEYNRQRGEIYLYTGAPMHFLRYDLATGALSDMGVPTPRASYILYSDAMDQRGRYYVGTAKDARLVVYDPAGEQVRDLGRMAEDPRQKYIIGLAVGPRGVVYCPVGLHHQELWAYDTRTGTKKQILPEKLMGGYGTPRLWVGPEGRVYGEVEDAEVVFLCQPDGIEVLEHLPAGVRRARDEPEQRRDAGPWRAVRIDGQGRLVLVHRESGEKRFVPTGFKGVGIGIMCVSAIREGYIYGGGHMPAHLFRFNPATGQSKDFGMVTGGDIQIYDILSHPRGLFMTSYDGGNLDLFLPDQPIEEGVNPIHIASLHQKYQQERIIQLELGPDGRIYGGSIPIKGHLGGALVRIDPKTLDVKVWRNVVPDQSCLYVAAIAETGEVLVGTSITGGSSAIPKAKEAVLFFWDCDKERITDRLKPIPGATAYFELTPTGDGVIYGVGRKDDGEHYFALDLETRRVLHRGKLPFRLSLPLTSGLFGPVGEGGRIFGISRDKELFAINPATHELKILARHDSLAEAWSVTVTPDGMLYYGTHANLWRVDLTH